MMKLLLIFCFLFPTAWAQKTVSGDVFQIQIRPVLKSIVSDFYQMISLFPDFPGSIVSIVDEVSKIQNEKDVLTQKCPQRLGKECSAEINRMRLSLLNAQMLTLKLLSQYRPGSNLYITSQAGIRTLQTLGLKIESIKGELDNLSLILLAKAKHKKLTYDLIKSLDDLNTYASLSVIEFVPFQYQSDFRHFYFNFIHPIELQMNKKKNYEFLNRNINSLNFALNLLNQNLTKRNKKTPEGMSPYLSVMHNKWNSLLRYYL
jgi:hypothetical protein